MEREKVEILVIEDDRSQAELIREMLAAQQRQLYLVRHVPYLAEGLDAMRQKDYDCVLVDLGLPDSQGLDTALALRRQAKEVAIVVLTVLDDEESAQAALNFDIQDYLIKGEINAAVLTRSIRYALQRKAVAERLAQSEERLRLATEAAEVGLWNWDLVRDELTLDERTKALFGFAADARPRFEAIMSALHPEDQVRVETGVRRALKEGGDYSEEMRIVATDGTLRWVSSKGRAFYNEHGEPLRLDGISMDISQRKQGEEALRQLNEELQLRAADLEVANKELEAFNYTVAHDLRQPLNVIYGYCQAIEMICGNQIDGDCREYLQDTYRGIRRMTRLLDSLLEFSRMSRVQPARSAVDLSKVAWGVVKELKDAEPQRAVTFRIPDGIEADGDPALLELVLRNLMGNAWKYTAREREAVIEIGVTERDGQITYFVRDNGPGFQAEEAEKLFLPFQRLAAAPGQGFGIGLATVARIIARHGGRVWAEGESGRGATFYFTLNGNYQQKG